MVKHITSFHARHYRRIKYLLLSSSRQARHLLVTHSKRVQRAISVRGELILAMTAIIGLFLLTLSVWPTKYDRRLTALDTAPPVRMPPDIVRMSDLGRIEQQLVRLDLLSQRLTAMEKASTTQEKRQREYVLRDIARIDQRLADVEQLNRRLDRLEKMSTDREAMQRIAISAMQETKIRLRTVEDQLGMLRISADDTKVGVDEIRDLLKEHMIRSIQQFEPRHDEPRTPPAMPTSPVPKIPDPKTSTR